MKVEIDGHGTYENDELSLNIKVKMLKKEKVPMYEIFQAANGNIKTLKQAYEDYGNLDMVDKSDDCGWKCENFAASRGELDVLKFLWECGCKLDNKAKESFDTCSDNISPAYQIVSSTNDMTDARVSCLKFLHAKLDLSNEREKLLACAIDNKRTDCIKFLIGLEKKVPMDDIFIAARNGDIDTLKQAYADYGNLDMWDEAHYPTWSCAHDAAFSGKLNVLKFLWECGCKLDSKKACGDTIVRKAVYSDEPECLKFLHEKLNLSSMTGELLTYAIERDSHKCTKFLNDLIKKADKKEKVPMKEIFNAATYGDIDTLKQAYADYGNLDMVDKSDRFEWRCEHYAAHFGQLDVLKFLWECGCTLCNKTGNGYKAADKAISGNRLQCLEFLHEKLDLSGVVEEWLDYAIKQESHACIQFLNDLRKKGEM